jgi:hypothetical protein
MDTGTSQNVSVIEPMSPAIERVKVMLFRPFDLSKWFTIGFCAWLAYLGKGGGGPGGPPNFNFLRSGGYKRHEPAVDEIKSFIIEHLPMVIIGAAAAIIIMITLWLVFTWLTSRGKFMFLHCVAGNKAEVKIPWAKFKDHANSLFLFKIVLSLISSAVMSVPCVIGAIFLIPAIIAKQVAVIVIGAVMLGFALLVIGIIFSLINKFTDDFVVPIMFLRMARCTAGWREFLNLLGTNKGRFALYILFQIALAVAIGFCVSMVCVVGCCCCGVSILLFIPYIGTVVLLPVFVFKRSYSLFFLKQFGLRFDVFLPDAIPVTGPA